MTLGKGRWGYLLEVPLIVTGILIFLAVLVPNLPGMVGKIFLVPSVVILIGGAYYMIVIPGWQPGNPTRLPYPLNLIVFFIIAVLIVAATVTYLFRG